MAVLKVVQPGQATALSTLPRAQVVAFVTDGESQRIVQHAISNWTEAPDSVRRGDISKAIDFLTSERSPNLLIVDISGASLPVSEIQRLADVCEPGVHVVAVGDRSDIGLFRDLMHVGVSDYIVKPLTHELVSKAVQIAIGVTAANPISQKLGKLVTVMGTRGGVGATTVAVNLAWHLSNRMGRRVALLDLDLQTGDCGLMLDVKSTTGLREMLDNPARLDNLFLERVMSAHGSHLFVLSAEEPMLDELKFSANAGEPLVTALRAQFHYVIVDLPRTPSALSKRVIDLASIRVIVADETIRSVRDIVRLKPVLGSDNSERRTMVVVNRAGEPRPGAIPAAAFASSLEMEPAVTIPFQRMSGTPPASYGAPAAAGSGRIATAIADLASEVSGQRSEKKGWKLWR